MVHRKIPPEAILQLSQRLASLPRHSSDRRALIQTTAELYGVSEHTIYRVLRERRQVKSARRSDYNRPRVMARATLERYCEIIAALKIRTSKGKVERPFRTVKEMHETLYHLHAPETESEANEWLMRFLLHYNSRPHRSESHSRIEDWVEHLPKSGVKSMCSWERFCTFALRTRETPSWYRCSYNCRWCFL